MKSQCCRIYLYNFIHFFLGGVTQYNPKHCDIIARSLKALAQASKNSPLDNNTIGQHDIEVFCGATNDRTALD